MTLAGIAENLVSDVLFVCLTFVIGWIILILARRNRLLRFFGIDDNRRLKVYLSNLRISQGGAVGIDGKKRSYEGSAGSLGEMSAANELRGLFNYSLPGTADTQSPLSKFLISDTRVAVALSPLTVADLEKTAPFISLGSTAYNVASRYIEESLNSRAKFKLGSGFLRSAMNSLTVPTTGTDPSPFQTGTAITEGQISPSSGSTMEIKTPPADYRPSGINLSRDPMAESTKSFRQSAKLNTTDPTQILVDGIPPIIDDNYGFVERVIDHQAHRTAYYVAGMSDNATTGAAGFLVSDWGKLQKEFGDKEPFLVVLRIEPTDHNKCAIIFKK